MRPSGYIPKHQRSGFSKAMMYFNFKLMWRLMIRSIWGTKGTEARLTPRRVAVLLFVALIYVINEFFVWTGLLLDEVFFKDYLHTRVKHLYGCSPALPYAKELFY
jgi:hypothetical protein